MAYDPTIWMNIQPFTELPADAPVTAMDWNSHWLAIVLLANHAEDAIQDIRETIATMEMMEAAIQAAADAAVSEDAAWQSAQAAALSEQAAALSEQNAGASEDASAASALSADNSADAAALSEQNAGASEDAAAISEANALGYSNSAAASNVAAGLAKTAAETAQGLAQAAATDAHNYQTAAGESATAASGFANAAAGSAAAALVSEQNAAESEGVVEGLIADLEAMILAGGYIAATEKGAANGVAELDATGKVPSAQLPSYVDDVEAYANLAGFPVTGETGKIYIAIDTNITYRWTGSDYAAIGSDLALGETSSTAYRGDRGKTAYDHSQAAHAPADAEANVQSDWTQATDTADDFIKNKPATFPPDAHTHSYIQLSGNTPGVIKNLVAGEAMGYGQVGYIGAGFKVYKASNAALATSYARVMCLGSSVQADDTVGFLIIGEVYNEEWSWTAGDNIWLSTAGNITHTEPTSGAFVVLLGHATSATSMIFAPVLLPLGV